MRSNMLPFQCRKAIREPCLEATNELENVELVSFMTNAARTCRVNRQNRWLSSGMNISELQHAVMAIQTASACVVAKASLPDEIKSHASQCFESKNHL